MPSTAEVIESCLIENTNVGRCNQVAEAVIEHLKAAGYVIVRKDALQEAIEAINQYCELGALAILTDVLELG